MSAMFALEGSFSKAMLRDLLVVKVPVLPDIATRINFVAHQVCICRNERPCFSNKHVWIHLLFLCIFLDMFFHLLFLCTFLKHTIVWLYAPPAELHLELNKSMIDKLDDPEMTRRSRGILGM